MRDGGEAGDGDGPGAACVELVLGFVADAQGGGGGVDFVGEGGGGDVQFVGGDADYGAWKGGC